jgi:hypothetical protein
LCRYARLTVRPPTGIESEMSLSFIFYFLSFLNEVQVYNKPAGMPRGSTSWAR